MKCPFCNNNDTSVKDSRISEGGYVVRRRRICPTCKARFSTHEVAKLKEIYVIKRSGIKKPFQRTKIFDSIATAVRKRNIEDSKIEKIVGKICAQLESSKETEIPSRKIGDMILTELAKIDEVAYIRFASVYKDFMTMQDFSRFISALQKK